MKKIFYEIPEGFKIGASSSAWQSEGWKGKKENQVSWADAFYKSAPSKWYESYGPTIATDFYSRYKEDIKLMNSLNLQSYRTSIDWSRFIEDYDNVIVSEDALNYYNDMINELIANNVQPIICLEHWELPDYLIQKYGGWGSRKVVDLYLRYAEKAFEAFSDRVKIWFTFNEPGVVPNLGVAEAIWYPYKVNFKESVQWNYHKVLATALTVKLFKEKGYNKDGGKIGIIQNVAQVYPRSNSEEDIKAAHMAELFADKTYLDPCIKGEFPSLLFETLEKHNCLPSYTDEDLEIIKNNTVDILGVNFYGPNRAKAKATKWNDENPFNPSYYFDSWSMPGATMNQSRGWEIYAKAFYDIAINIKNNYRNIEWMIMENGMGVHDEYKHKDLKGQIQDDYRIDYISDHLRWLFKAIKDENANCTAYHMWNFTDNVSPMNAFRNRYGFVEIDLSNNRSRRVKKSGEWIKKVIDRGGFEYKSFEDELK
ncbi:glycoside hydrolase family 1 protein [Clostridium intestinale]|uniref:Beta-glucosidase n=1 Tax=Clostridium intestinale DSM 6191 TaxID=1121320 RepID=A0A1M5Z926_9CLOT|nr:glycoside hydrolase family 1 protein [Clostridium intestinale]SHI20413.1 beta-glucosidase [Clostridium intestinale DSM 6191]